MVLKMGIGGGVSVAFPPATNGSAAPKGLSAGAMLNGNFHGASQIEKATH
jgi:hypothetical protein